jgi:hypothetical protein
MSGQLSHRDLVWSLLELDNLLIDKSTLFVDDKVWVERTLWCGIVGNAFPRALPGQCDACETAEDRESLGMAAISALNMQLGCLGGHD